MSDKVTPVAASANAAPAAPQGAKASPESGTIVLPPPADGPGKAASDLGAESSPSAAAEADADAGAAAATQAGDTAAAAAPQPRSATPQQNPWGAQSQLRTGMITLVVLVLGFGGWSMLAQIAGAVIAMGQIEVENNRQVVQHPDGGVVSDILVTEAQTVKAGDVLMRLNGTGLLAELAIVESQYFESVARRARLEAERDDAAAPVFPSELILAAQVDPAVQELMEGQRALFVTRAETLAKQIEQMQKRKQQIAAQIQGNDAQIAALKTQLDLTIAEMRDQKTLLDKGLTQSGRVAALERQMAQFQGEIGGLEAARAENQGRGTEVDLEILRIASLRREQASTELRDVGQKEVELMERRIALRERAAKLEIRAPVSGTVLGLRVTSPQAVISPAEPLLYIVPQDRPLVIMAQVDPIHVDEVHVGQAVRLVFPALSSRTTPLIYGHVETVSAGAIVDEASKTSFYRVEILLQPGEREKLAHETLLPGMPVQAFISTGSRTPMAYFVKPFTDYLRTALRET